jgi:SAM-dependent methyltransferase
VPTLPSGSPEPHQHRQIAESFGADAERYDRARPRYPAALLDRLVAGRDRPAVLDVGCGTGIVARQLRDRHCAVLGVEVDPRMAELARQTGVDVEVSSIEDWDPRGRVFDVVVAGQAWHWVDPVAGAAKARAVLPPGGRFAAFWNYGQPPADLGAAFAAVYERLLPDLPFDLGKLPAGSPYAAMCATAAAGLRTAGGFGAAQEWHFTWEHTYTRADWLDVLPTQGAFTRLPAARLAEVLAGIGAAIDAAGGSFPMSYETVTVTSAAE